MLTPVQEKEFTARGMNIAVVAAKYNARYVDGLVAACGKQLKQAGATVVVERVPGSFEIPVVAAHFAASREPKFDAVICFGVIFQGQTRHADHIALGVTHALADLQIRHNVPVIHGVLLFTDEEQASVRCLEAEHNRGTEAAQVAIEMAKLMQTLRPKQ